MSNDPTIHLQSGRVQRLHSSVEERIPQCLRPEGQFSPSRSRQHCSHVTSSIEERIPRCPRSDDRLSSSRSRQQHCSQITVSLTISPTPSSSQQYITASERRQSRLQARHDPVSSSGLSATSRPSSPPPATYFPSPRRPSLSLPPSPASLRVHRASLPSLLSGTRSPLSSTSWHHSAYVPARSSSRPRSATPPPSHRRSPRRRSTTRTPSPRPPLPPSPSPVEGQPQPQPQGQQGRGSQECQPYKLKMRSR